MKKEVGYAVAILGLVVMAIGFGMIPVKLAFLEGVAGDYIAGAGGILIVVGIVLSINKGGGRKKPKSGEDEIPIFKGVGKNRKVVGYRRD
jgi:hypothetical protein